LHQVQVVDDDICEVYVTKVGASSGGVKLAYSTEKVMDVRYDQ
jgi:hypothetical protein